MMVQMKNKASKRNLEWPAPVTVAKLQRSDLHWGPFRVGIVL